MKIPTLRILYGNEASTLQIQDRPMRSTGEWSEINLWEQLKGALGLTRHQQYITYVLILGLNTRIKRKLQEKQNKLFSTKRGRRNLRDKGNDGHSDTGRGH